MTDTYTAIVTGSDRYIDGTVGVADDDGTVPYAYPRFAVSYGSSYGQPGGWSSKVSRSGSGSKTPDESRTYATAELLACDVADAVMAEITAHGVTRVETVEEHEALLARFQAVADSLIRQANRQGVARAAMLGGTT